MTLAGPPETWQNGKDEPRSHDSRYDGKRFMLRLDGATWDKLEALSSHFGVSIAEVIPQLVASAQGKDFPQS